MSPFNTEYPLYYQPGKRAEPEAGRFHPAARISVGVGGVAGLGAGLALCLVALKASPGLTELAAPTAVVCEAGGGILAYLAIANNNPLVDKLDQPD